MIEAHDKTTIRTRAPQDWWWIPLPVHELAGAGGQFHPKVSVVRKHCPFLDS
jgi:hypothetical protein